MEETNAADYQLLVNEGFHSGVYIALLATVEEFFTTTMVWHAQTGFLARIWESMSTFEEIDTTKTTRSAVFECGVIAIFEN